MAVGRDDQALMLCEQAANRPNSPDNVWLMLAQLHLRAQLKLPPEQRSWQRLESVLGQAARAMPDSWEIPLLRANAVLMQNGRDGAGQVMQILASEEASHPDTIPFWTNVVFLYERLGMPADADRAMQHLHTLTTGSAQGPGWHAALLAARKDFQQAQQMLEQARAQSLADPQWLDRAELFLAYQRGDLAEIRRVLLRLLATRPQGTELLVQLADLALTEGNWVESDRWIAQLREAEGSDGVWWRFFQARRLLASDPQAENVSTRVVALYDDIRRLRPWWPGAALLRGMVAQRQGRAEEAVDSYLTAVRGGMQQPYVYQQLIRMLYQQGRFREAEQWLVQLQQQMPLDAKVLDLAWSAAVQHDQSDLAIRLARENLRQHPDEPAAYIWLAQMLWIQGVRTEATELIEQARLLEPRDVASWSSLLAFYLRSGQSTAVEQCLNVLRDHPDFSEPQFASLEAQIYHQLGKRDAAELAYQEALRHAPDDPTLQVQYATFLRPVEPQRAEKLLRDTLQTSPQHDGARRTLAAWLHGSDNHESQQEANELLQSASVTWQQQSLDRRLEAMLLLQRGAPEDLRAAQILLEQLIDDPRAVAPDDRLLLARLYENAGNLPLAEKQLVALLADEPPPARYLATYVDYLLRHDRPDDARKQLERLERQAPMSLSAVSLRSRLLMTTGQPEQIDTYLNAFAQQQLGQLKDDQQRQQFMMQIAELFASVKRTESAEQWYKRLAQEYPDAREPLLQFWARQDQMPKALDYAWQQVQREATPTTAAMYARMLVQRTGEVTIDPQAESVLDDMLRRFPDDADLLFSIASLRLKQQRTDEAIGLLRRLTASHPDHLTAWNNLAAVLADDDARLDEALDCIDRALAAAPKPIANLLDTKAVILLRLGRNAEAATLLQRVLALEGTPDPRYHLHAALAQQRLGEQDAAKAAWQRAVAQGVSEKYLTQFEQEMTRTLKSSFDSPAAGS
jgi:predicted Zn-dependent protease